MTIYAAPPRTLAIEQHNGTLWLCAIGSGATQLLAQFSCPANAETWKAIHAASLAHAQASGAMGI